MIAASDQLEQRSDSPDDARHTDSTPKPAAPRFYWALVDAPALGGSRPRAHAQAQLLPPGLLSDLADQVPIDAQSLHAVALALPDESAPLPDAAAPSQPSRVAPARALICAAESDRLRAFQHNYPEANLLCPPAIPDLLTLAEPRAAQLSPECFNLLVGAFEPAERRKARRHRHAVAACVLLACSVLVSLGLFRRASAWERDSEQTRSHIQQLLAQLPESPAHRDRPGQSRAPELASFWAARHDAASSVIAQAGLAGGSSSPNGSIGPSRDAVSHLDALLARWPSTHAANLKPLNVSVSATSITLSLLFESSADPSPFLATFAPPSGWRLQEPRLTRADPATTRVHLTLTPTPEGGGSVSSTSATSSAAAKSNTEGRSTP